MHTWSHIDEVPGIRCTVGESPLWSTAHAAWYWVDIVGRTIWRLDAAGRIRNWYTSEMVACLGLRQNGCLIAGMESGIFSLVLGAEQLAVETLLVSTPEHTPGMRFNDGRCDRQGRFWSGTMLMENPTARADGKLYRYSQAEGLSAPVIAELVVQNGLGWSPDGRTMYLSDSHMSRQLIWAFDYDIDDGVPSHRRLFVDMNQHPGRPDGAAVDSEGCYWICGNDAGCILRFTPDGKLDRRLDVPMAKPSMCSFGGVDMQSLLVTSIAAGAPAGDQAAGAVVLVRPGVAGLAETPFPG